jgi:hypothetical protein
MFMRRVANDATVASRDGQYYLDTQGRIWATGHGQVGAIAEWGRWSGSWAGDGDYLCGLVKDSSGAYSLDVTDLEGGSRRLALNDTGPDANVLACSTNTNRAVMLEQSGMTIRSLSDGHVERTIKAPNQAFPVSPDLQWLAVTSLSQSGDVWDTKIIGLADGTVQAQLPGALAAAFMPDGKHVVVADRAATRTRMVDWRTGSELWSGRGGAEPVAMSDTLTGKMVIDLVTGSAEAGTNKNDYWIVDGTGAALQFIPA